MARGDDLKQRIRNGDLIIGVSAPIDSTKSRLEEILGKDDYGFVSTDSQHSAFNEETLVRFCSFAEELDMPVQFRIKNTRHTYQIGNLLDLGPLGIEVPLVNDMAVVDDAIENFYYPQVGKRSWGGAVRYGIQGREDRLTYADWWNSRGILCLQVETINTVTNARQYAKQGIGCFTWGPADLSFDLEAHPQHPFRSVDDCLQHVLKQIEGMDTKVSFRSYDPNLRNKYIDMGVTVLMERPKP